MPHIKLMSKLSAMVEAGCNVSCILILELYLGSTQMMHYNLQVVILSQRSKIILEVCFIGCLSPTENARNISPELFPPADPPLPTPIAARLAI